VATRFLLGLAQAIGIVAVVLIVAEVTCNMMLWGQPFPSRRVDKLDHPAKVVGWNPKGLALEDGRRVLPAGMADLPIDSHTLRVATQHGVEVAPDGRVFGLIKIWHWCGNDPVRYDLSRVDIGQLLAYHHEGRSTIKPYEYSDASFQKAGGGSDRGWSSSHRSRMRMMFDPRYAALFGPSAPSLPKNAYKGPALADR
jgi:hypothetical protein